MQAPREDTATKYIAIGDLCYPEDSFLAAVNTVGLEVIAKRLSETKTDRQLLRALNGVKKSDVADLVRIESLKRVSTERKGLTRGEVRTLGGKVVATFPALV